MRGCVHAREADIPHITKSLSSWTLLFSCASIHFQSNFYTLMPYEIKEYSSIWRTIASRGSQSKGAYGVEKKRRLPINVKKPFEMALYL